MSKKAEKREKTDVPQTESSSAHDAAHNAAHKEWREKLARWEDNKIRAYFVRLFEKYDVHNEQQFVTIGKWLIFVILIVVELFVVLQHLDRYLEVLDQTSGIMFGVVVLLVVILTLSEGLKLFVFKTGKGRFIFYVFDALAAVGFSLVAGDLFPILLYMLVLTEFYIAAAKTRQCVLSLCVGTAVYIAGNYVKNYLLYEMEFVLSQVLTQSFGAIVTLIIHFTVVNIALAFYRQFLRLDKALRQVDESKRELEKAYAVVAEVTALEERQRIAKEIHDTAGHSLTTVIMQTEAAKLILDEKPEEAKSKIIAANLQAKHALEELRDSVHLLSGLSENKTLKTALTDVIHESTDGTGITIRSEIADVDVSDAKYRFLCNTLKEGISNGLRHGGATAFWFELKAEEDKLLFLLSDNGKGAINGQIEAGFGLTTMQQRARSFGGEVSYDAEIDEGFELRLRLPLDCQIGKEEQRGKEYGGE
ncbi:MAG: sensor histidine kinase [Clostridia bacterium]|nr:sensor histidine kinase [Clostridia bacterium]